MQITKRIQIAKPAELVWQIIGPEFEHAHKWMGPIPDSYAMNEGPAIAGAPMQGRICHLSDNPNGAKAREEIIQYSDAGCSLTFEVTSINVPAIVPMKKNRVKMTVHAISDNSCEVVWVANLQLKAFGYLFYPLLRLAIPAAFGKLLTGLKPRFPH